MPQHRIFGGTAQQLASPFPVGSDIAPSWPRPSPAARTDRPGPSSGNKYQRPARGFSRVSGNGGGWPGPQALREHVRAQARQKGDLAGQEEYLVGQMTDLPDEGLVVDGGESLRHIPTLAACQFCYVLAGHAHTSPRVSVEARHYRQLAHRTPAPAPARPMLP